MYKEYQVALRKTHERVSCIYNTKKEAEIEIKKLENLDVRIDRYKPNTYCIVTTIYED